MSWIHEIPTGVLLNPDGTQEDVGYAGHPPHVNDIKAIGIRGVGPCPPGHYTITAMIENDPQCGEYVLVLTPDAATRAYIISLGRDPDSFRCHGDEVNHIGQELASDGCLIHSHTARVAMWTSTDHGVDVVASLPAPPVNMTDE